MIDTTNGHSILADPATSELFVKQAAPASIALTISDTRYTNTESNNAYRIPIVKADPNASWVAEGAEITPSDPTFGEITSPYYKVGALAVASSEIVDDAREDEQLTVMNGLMRDIARKIDAAYFTTHAGNPNQPKGLEDLTEATNIKTPTTAWQNIDPFIEAIYKATQQGAEVTAFAANPEDAWLLSQLKDQQGSNRPLLGPDPTNPVQQVIQGVPLYVSRHVTKGTVWAIPRTRSVIAVRRDVQVASDFGAFFTSDRIALRATMRAAFLFPQPEAIIKIELKK